MARVKTWRSRARVLAALRAGATVSVSRTTYRPIMETADGPVQIEAALWRELRRSERWSFEKLPEETRYRLEQPDKETQRTSVSTGA